MTNERNGTLYIGVTSNLPVRVAKHREGHYGGFTAEYKLDWLVWYEWHAIMPEAILREKRVKKWNRLWKLKLIEEMNPDWEDLYDKLIF
ncbi:MAG: GIY-YIG nuclease family protein [Planctomycetaceae bacterium]|nr:GIY-YIG nuclease family protein [Planctomycetaceae bacterium]